MEPGVVVIMAGDQKPRFIAMPVPDAAAQFPDQV